MRPGDELLVITDGITEAMDPLQNVFGDARVAELVSSRTESEPKLLQKLLAQVRVFEAGSAQTDDIAAILLRLATDRLYG